MWGKPAGDFERPLSTDSVSNEPEVGDLTPLIRFPQQAPVVGDREMMAAWKNSNSWSISLTSTGSYSWAGYSTPNYMTASEIYVGETLQGTANSYSLPVTWGSNMWKSGSTGLWYYQTRPDPSPGDVDYITTSIMSGWWNPKPSQSSTGGVWTAQTNTSLSSQTTRQFDDL